MKFNALSEPQTPTQALAEDEARWTEACMKRDEARTFVGRGLHTLRALYLGAIVEQDLGAVEAEAVAALPEPRPAVEA